MYDNIYNSQLDHGINNIHNINRFSPLLGCFEDMCSCSMGLLFPYCLFGRIYERAQFGKCWIGCCKYLSLQLIINMFFSIIIYNMEWNMLLSKKIDFTNKLEICNNNNTCLENIEYFNYEKFYDNKCSLSNSTIICECSKQTLIDECKYNINTLPHVLNIFFAYITIISFINLLVLSCFNGLFLGHYRKKISHKYNILYNSRYNFLVHCIPCINQCALCQEYNTIDIIESIVVPIYTIDEKKFNA
jgi:Cys-rich protein (TIGR01571 family)